MLQTDSSNMKAPFKIFFCTSHLLHTVVIFKSSESGKYHCHTVKDEHHTFCYGFLCGECGYFLEALATV